MAVLCVPVNTDTNTSELSELKTVLEDGALWKKCVWDSNKTETSNCNYPLMTLYIDKGHFYISFSHTWYNDTEKLKILVILHHNRRHHHHRCWDKRCLRPYYHLKGAPSQVASWYSDSFFRFHPQKFLFSRHCAFNPGWQIHLFYRFQHLWLLQSF